MQSISVWEPEEVCKIHVMPFHMKSLMQYHAQFINSKRINCKSNNVIPTSASLIIPHQTEF